MSTHSQELAKLFSSFEECRFEHDGAEAWRARDIMGSLGYKTWEGFRDAIERAWKACASAGISTDSNFLVGDGSVPWQPGEVFRHVSKNPLGGRPSEDVILTRRAAYLVVMNGDPAKAEIAFAQQYFAASTRTLEVIEQRMAETARCTFKGSPLRLLRDVAAQNDSWRTVVRAAVIQVGVEHQDHPFGDVLGQRGRGENRPDAPIG